MTYRRKTAAVAAYLFLTVVLPLMSFSSETTVIVVTVYSIVFSLGLVWYWLGGKTILQQQTVTILEKNECIDIHKEIKQFKKKSKLDVRIQIGFLDEAMPNAFTLFLGPKHYLIVFSVGLFENLDHDEIQTVLAHELSHIKNKDVFLKAFFIIGRYCSFPFGPLVEAFVSRFREYRADEESARFTGNPIALATALVKMTKCYLTSDSDFKAPVARSFLILDSSINSNKGIFRTLFSRHPSIQNRVERLKTIAKSV